MADRVTEVDTGEFLVESAGMSAVMARDRHQQRVIEKLADQIRRMAMVIHTNDHDLMTPIHMCRYQRCREVREILTGV